MKKLENSNPRDPNKLIGFCAQKLGKEDKESWWTRWEELWSLSPSFSAWIPGQGREEMIGIISEGYIITSAWDASWVIALEENSLFSENMLQFWRGGHDSNNFTLKWFSKAVREQLIAQAAAHWRVRWTEDGRSHVHALFSKAQSDKITQN